MTIAELTLIMNVGLDDTIILRIVILDSPIITITHWTATTKGKVNEENEKYQSHAEEEHQHEMIIGSLGQRPHAATWKYRHARVEGYKRIVTRRDGGEPLSHQPRGLNSWRPSEEEALARRSIAQETTVTSVIEMKGIRIGSTVDVAAVTTLAEDAVRTETLHGHPKAALDTTGGMLMVHMMPRTMMPMVLGDLLAADPPIMPTVAAVQLRTAASSSAASAGAFLREGNGTYVIYQEGEGDMNIYGNEGNKLASARMVATARRKGRVADPMTTWDNITVIAVDLTPVEGDMTTMTTKKIMQEGRRNEERDQVTQKDGPLVTYLVADRATESPARAYLGTVSRGGQPETLTANITAPITGIYQAIGASMEMKLGAKQNAMRKTETACKGRVSCAAAEKRPSILVVQWCIAVGILSSRTWTTWRTRPQPSPRGRGAAARDGTWKPMTGPHLQCARRTCTIFKIERPTLVKIVI